MTGLPAWVISARRERGLCERCGRPGCSFWQSEAGPWLCWPCIEIRRQADEPGQDPS